MYNYWNEAKIELWTDFGSNEVFLSDEIVFHVVTKGTDCVCVHDYVLHKSHTHALSMSS